MHPGRRGCFCWPYFKLSRRRYGVGRSKGSPGNVMYILRLMLSYIHVYQNQVRARRTALRLKFLLLIVTVQRRDEPDDDRTVTPWHKSIDMSTITVPIYPNLSYPIHTNDQGGRANKWQYSISMLELGSDEKHWENCSDMVYWKLVVCHGCHPHPR